MQRSSMVSGISRCLGVSLNELAHLAGQPSSTPSRLIELGMSFAY